MGLSEQTLINLALQLGSDCPFFILNRPVIATGRGEIMQPIELDLSTYTLVIINPGIHISTAAAFNGVIPGEQGADLATAISNPVSAWKDLIHNDFETTVFAQYPEVAAIKTMLYEKGAVYAAMSGSGSSVYGLFRDRPNLPLLPSWKHIEVRLK